MSSIKRVAKDLTSSVLHPRRSAREIKSRHAKPVEPSPAPTHYVQNKGKAREQEKMIPGEAARRDGDGVGSKGEATRRGEDSRQQGQDKFQAAGFRTDKEEASDAVEGLEQIQEDTMLAPPPLSCAEDEIETQERLEGLWLALGREDQGRLVRGWTNILDRSHPDANDFEKTIIFYINLFESIFAKLPESAQRVLSSSSEGWQIPPLDHQGFYGSSFRALSPFPRNRLLDMVFVVTARPWQLGRPQDADDNLLQFHEAMGDSFGQPFLGETVEALHSHLKNLEHIMCEQDFSHQGAYHSRCLSLIQSSGCGKSRLVQELQKAPECYVISICLRKEKDLGQYGYPLGDTEICKLLTEPAGLSKVPQRDGGYVQRIRVAAFLSSLYTQAAMILKEKRPPSMSAANVWARRIARPNREKGPNYREQFLHGVLQSARALLEEWQTISEESSAMSAAQNTAIRAAIDLQGLLEPNALLIVALDEASTLSEGSKHQTHSIDSVRSLFVPSISESLSAPARSWLLLCDTNSSLGTIVPRQAEATSARLYQGTLKLFGPFFAFPINVKLTKDRQNKLLWELPPLVSSIRSIQALFGRPLWSSYVVTKAPSRPPTATDSCSAQLEGLPGPQPQGLPDSASFGKPPTRRGRVSDQSKTSVHTAGSTSAPLTGDVHCLLTTGTILLKLFSRHDEHGKFGPLDDDATIALLNQRLSLDFMGDTTFGSRLPVAAEEFTRRQVHHHLRYITGYGDFAMQTKAISEPVVTAVVATLFRDEAAQMKWIHVTRDLVDRTLWSHAWSTLRKQFLGDANTLDVGKAGEVSVQAICCMAIDSAKRRTLSSIDAILHKTNQLEAHSNFVHLADFLRVLLNESAVASKCQGSWDNLLAFVDSQNDLWLSFARFSKMMGDLEEFSLAQAGLRHEALVLRENAKDYDLVIPVYCGPLDEPHDPNNYTFMAVQVKIRNASSTPALPDLKVSNFEPRQPPIYVWLETRQTASQLSSPLEIAASRRATGELSSFRVVSRSFDAHNHPALEMALGTVAAKQFALLPQLALLPAEGLSTQAQHILDQVLRDDWAAEVKSKPSQAL
ncbi:unnamed protein product [Sympodiomycopsis kandeliae]